MPLLFEGVSFAYAGRRVLADASLRAGPGETTAVFAANGEGKSTLLALALGLLEPDSGTIALGPNALHDLDLHALRRVTGALPQAPLFLPVSIRENIAYGRPDLDAASIARAAWRAGLEPVLERLPEGIDSPMGEGGHLLSGGERQRVAIARALVHAPTLVVLDEPSNHLDNAAVALLIERLFRAPDRPTILMATHDPRLLAVADSIYDLAAGVMAPRAALKRVSP
jgi:ATP-binding cassette subfamily B protein